MKVYFEFHHFAEKEAPIRVSKNPITASEVGRTVVAVSWADFCSSCRRAKKDLDISEAELAEFNEKNSSEISSIFSALEDIDEKKRALATNEAFDALEKEEDDLYTSLNAITSKRDDLEEAVAEAKKALAKTGALHLDGWE